MGSFARGCVSPVAISGRDIKQASAYRRLFGSQPSLVTAPNTFGLLPDRRAPFWTFARRSGTVPWEGRQACDGCDDRIPGTYIRRAPNRRPVHRSPEASPVRSGRCCLRGCQSLPLVQRSPADERERTRTGTAPAGPGVVRKLLQGHRDQRSPKEAAGPAEGKGTSGVECSEPREHESHAETASGTMQVVGLGCARRGHDGLHRLDAALNLLPERYLVEMRRRVTIATASRAPPRTPWKPPWYSTSSTWQRRRGVRCSSPAHRRACRHLVRDPMGADRRTVTLGSSCGGPQPPRVAGAWMRTEEEPGQRGAGARPGQAAVTGVTGALSHASCSPPHRSTRPGALCGGGGFFRGDQSLPFFARGPADA